MDRDPLVVDLLTKMGAQLPIMQRMLVELIGTVALTHPDPRGFAYRMMDRAEDDLRVSFASPETSDALRHGLEMVDQMRSNLAGLPRVEEDS